MIIDERGNILPAWFRKDGNTIHDTENKYNMDFHVCVYYSDEQKALYAEKKELKLYLKETDFRAIKYAEGAYTEEEYAPYKEAREKARARINEIEESFVEPTLTREQLDAAEDSAMLKMRREKTDE